MQDQPLYIHLWFQEPHTPLEEQLILENAWLFPLLSFAHILVQHYAHWWWPLTSHHRVVDLMLIILLYWNKNQLSALKLKQLSNYSHDFLKPFILPGVSQQGCKNVVKEMRERERELNEVSFLKRLFKQQPVESWHTFCICRSKKNLKKHLLLDLNQKANT